MKKIFLLSSFSLFLCSSQMLIAEDAQPAPTPVPAVGDIKVPLGQQTPELEKTARPTTGMKKATVMSQFGEPIKQNPEKGKPPISSWEYADFVVYFESDYVIHSVLKPKYHETKETVIEETVEMKESQLKTK